MTPRNIRNKGNRILYIFTIIAISLLTVETSMAQAFKHPGIRNSKEELDVIKARVNAGQEPQKMGWEKMLSNKVSAAEYKHQPCPSFTFDGCRGRAMEDSAAAYSNAMQWYVKGDTSKAEKAITIINDWVRVTNFKQSCLAAGWSMPMMINAGEIMRMYPGWKSDDQAKFKSWLGDKLWPFAADCSAGDANNWDSGGIALAIAIAIFTDNRGRFDSAVGRLRSFTNRYVTDRGCVTESKRDQGHAQMGLGHLAVGAEYAWHQGVDAWSHGDNRLHKAYELQAKYNLGETAGCNDNSKFRGNFGHTMWEVAYNHFVNRKKMAMPYSARVFSAKGVRGIYRPETLDNDMLPWGTLFHAELGNLDGKVPTPDPVVTHTLQLKAGWNLISLPINPSNTNIADLLKPISGQFEAVYAFNGTEYETYIEGDSTSNLTKLEAGRGYWIYLSKDASLSVSGVKASNSISFSAGWNLIGFNSTTAIGYSQALASTGGKIEAGFSFDTASNSYQEIQTFRPGSGYWMYATEAGTWTLP
jgi:hypothetical protein